MVCWCPLCHPSRRGVLSPVMSPSRRGALLLMVLPVALLLPMVSPVVLPCAAAVVSPIEPPCTAARYATCRAGACCCPSYCLLCCRALLPVVPPIVLPIVPLHAVAVVLPVVSPCTAGCHTACCAGARCCPLRHLSCCGALLVLGCPCGVKEAGTGLWGLHTEPGESKIRVSVTYHWCSCWRVRSRCC